RDEMKGRVALHLDRRARVVGEDEHGNVIGRIRPPPALPAHVRPGATTRREHVSPEYPRTHVPESPRSEIVVHSRFTTFLSMHLPPGASRKEPPVQLLSADAERIVEALIGTRSVAVDRDREAVDPNCGHPGHSR